MSDIRLVKKTPVFDVGFPLSLILVGFNIQRHIDVSLQSSYSYLTSMVRRNGSRSHKIPQKSSRAFSRKERRGIFTCDELYTYKDTLFYPEVDTHRYSWSKGKATQGRRADIGNVNESDT